MTLQEYFTSPSTWCQGRTGRQDERGVYLSSDAPKHLVKKRCLRVAIDYCYPKVDEASVVVSQLVKTLRTINPDLGYSDLMLWNDDPNRTFSDILQLVKLANV